MSPPRAARIGQYLEHPREAFSYYAQHGVHRVVCEEKHMGSRAISLVLREPHCPPFESVAAHGVVYSRTGRPLFNSDLQAQFTQQLAAAVSELGWWETFNTDWFLLDAEILPWSFNARGLIRREFAPMAAAGRSQYALLAQLDGGKPEWRTEARLAQHYVGRFAPIYRNYCQPTDGLTGVRVAPFHVLAGAGRVYDDRTHGWHMERCAELATVSEYIAPTEWREVCLDDDTAVKEAIAWWTRHTKALGEGFVVKPREFIAERDGRIVQPALKVRGREYLRIIYGPEYTLPANLAHLRTSRRTRGKRRAAFQEFILGLEGLHRFVNGADFGAYHECVFGVLALEGEAIDPTL